MAKPRVKERLRLDDDCISAFSQSETLDEANPWYEHILNCRYDFPCFRKRYKISFPVQTELINFYDP